jgi:hypothetical protein
MEDVMTPEDIKIKVQNATHIMDVPEVELWFTHSFAPDWFKDAMHEAKAPLGDVDARRREILFSVAFAESYIVEWLRDEVLKRDYRKFWDYFGPKVKFSAKEKWLEIPKRLYAENLIPRCPDLGQHFWEEFLTLISYRDGLVHAGSSRPESSSLSKYEKPLPQVSVLGQLQPAWAIKTVVLLVKELHEKAATALPSWITLP